MLGVQVAALKDVLEAVLQGCDFAMRPRLASEPPLPLSYAPTLLFCFRTFF